MTIPASSTVSAGDATLASHYNNLRLDALCLGQAVANSAYLYQLLERYETRLDIEILSTDKVRVPATTAAPVSLVVAGYILQATANVDLADADKPSGGANTYYIFANQTVASTTFTLTVSTSASPAANQRGIGRFYWDGTKIEKDSIRSELAISITDLLYFIEPHICDGRLSVSTGLSVPVADVASSASVFFTPHSGNRVSLYVPGYGWRVYYFSELTLDISAVATDTNLDIWLYDNAGTLTLAYTAWSNDTLRATALQRQDGVWCKAGALNYRYLGTVRTSGAGVTCDTKGARFVWNAYNRVARSLYVHDSTISWTYGVRTLRSWNNSDTNRVKFVLGLDIDLVELSFAGFSSLASAADRAISLGLDSNSVSATDCFKASSNITLIFQMIARYLGYPGIGYHYLQLLECGGSGVNATFYGVYNSGTAVEGKSLALGRVFG